MKQKEKQMKNGKYKLLQACLDQVVKIDNDASKLLKRNERQDKEEYNFLLQTKKELKEKIQQLTKEIQEGIK